MEVATHRSNAHNPRVRRTLSSQEAVAMRRRMARGTSRMSTASPRQGDRAEQPSAEPYLDGHTAIDEVPPVDLRTKMVFAGFSFSAVAVLAALVLA